MNKFEIIGNLTRDVELKQTAAGNTFAMLSVAVSRKYKTADGERLTDFFNAVAWNNTAQTLAKYSRKGNKIFLAGELHNRSYTDNSGVKHTVSELEISDFEFISSLDKSTDKKDPEEVFKDTPFEKPKTKDQVTFEDIDDEENPF